MKSIKSIVLFVVLLFSVQFAQAQYGSQSSLFESEGPCFSMEIKKLNTIPGHFCIEITVDFKDAMGDEQGVLISDGGANSISCKSSKCSAIWCYRPDEEMDLYISCRTQILKDQVYCFQEDGCIVVIGP